MANWYYVAQWGGEYKVGSFDRGAVMVVTVLGPARGRLELVVWRVDGLDENWGDFMPFCYDSVRRVRTNCLQGNLLKNSPLD